MKKYSIKSMLWCFFCFNFLVGCTQLPQDKTHVEWQQHQRSLSELTHYQTSGKLGFISPQERRSMNFYWKQDGDHAQLRLTSPFGQTLLKMTISPDKTRIETYDDKVYQSPNGEQLLYQLTGLVIPLNQLPEWLKGSASNADHYTLLPTHTVATQTTQLNQQLWQINYKSYQDITTPQGVLPLPSSLSLHQNDIKINLRLSQWKIN